MTAQGTILIADDEDTFLEATKDLLEEEGYECHGVGDAHQLSQALKRSEFDLLITDLNMPGNHVMKKVQALREQARILPVIVITGYPSVPTAVESVHLNVLEYMIKPVDFQVLLEAVKRGLHHRKTLTSLRQARYDAEQRSQRLARLEETLSTLQLPLDPECTPSMLSDSSLPTQAMRTTNLSESVGPQQHLLQTSLPKDSSPSMTDYFRLRESVYHTIQILQKTKSAFRSKDLAGLRKHLEDVLRETTETLKDPQPPADNPKDGG